MLNSLQFILTHRNIVSIYKKVLLLKINLIVVCEKKIGFIKMTFNLNLCFYMLNNLLILYFKPSFVSLMVFKLLAVKAFPSKNETPVAPLSFANKIASFNSLSDFKPGI